MRPSDLELLDTEYVVFDTETTGLNAAGGDQMIEIGAVKIKNGEITDTFDELIDPNRPIPVEITKLTNITDEMVKGKDNEEKVTRKFLDWAKDAPMVAHNAKFDVSFIEMSMKKYNLGQFKNTVIDTLELSRTLDQGYARHSLSALVSRYNVDFDEVSYNEVEDFCNSVIKLRKQVTCEKHNYYINFDKSKKSMECSKDNCNFIIDMNTFKFEEDSEAASDD